MAIFIDSHNEIITSDLDLSKEQLRPKEYEDLGIEQNEAVTGYDFILPALGHSDWDGHIYVSGATGSGKTFVINRMIMNDKKKRKVFLFTSIKDRDPTLMPSFRSGRLKIITNTPTKSWHATTGDLKRFIKGSIVVFDDVDENKKEIFKFRDKLLERGRHMNSVAIVVNHKLRDSVPTKKPLNECRFLIAFPSSNKGAVNRFMKDRMEMETKARRVVLRRAQLEGRHIVFHKFFPNMVATHSSVIKI